MIGAVARKLFGSANERRIRSYQPRVAAINALEQELAALSDEALKARTPLIISGPLDDRSEFYNTIDSYIPALDKADYEIDEKQRTVTLTEAGMEKLEQRLRTANELKGESL